MSTIPSRTYESGSIQDTKCERCIFLENNYTCTEDRFYTIHINKATLFGKKQSLTKEQKEHRDQDKLKFKEILQKHVAALRNTKGGDILIHVEEQKKEDRNLQFIDECMSSWLNDLIADGSTYTDNYKRLWINDSETQSPKDCHDVILLKVLVSQFLVTVEFNSKVRYDHEVVKANTSNIVSILLREERDKSLESSTPIKRWKPDLKTEDRSIEVKSLSVDRESKLKDKLGNVEKVTRYIWHTLKLKDNISSMSKVCDGGSYILGVGEEKEDSDPYTKKLVTQGIKVGVKPEDLKKALDEKIDSNVLVLQGTEFNKGSGGLIKTIVHKTKTQTDEDVFILEVAIGFCKGLVFSDKDGPRTYTIEDNQIVKVTKDVWLKKMKETCYICNRALQ